MKKLLFFVLVFIANFSLGMEAEFPEVPRNTSAKDYKCEYCQYSYNNIEDLQRHKEMMHKDDITDISLEENNNDISELGSFRRQEILVFISHAFSNFTSQALKEFYLQLLKSLVNTKKSLYENVFLDEPLDSIGLDQHPLIIAIINGYQFLDELIEIEKKLGKLDMPIGRMQRTALFFAVEADREQLVNKLIKAGANVNVKDSNGKSILMYAAFSTPKIISNLIDAGADLSCRSNDDITFLDIAIVENPEVISCILENHDFSNVLNSTDKKGNTPLMIAVQHNKFELISILIKKGVPIDAKNKKGATALFLSLSNPQILSELIAHGAKFNDTDKKGYTPLIYASALNAESVVILIKAGANIDVKDNKGRSLLMIAISQCPEAAEELLRFGKIDLDMLDNQGNCALIYASQYNQQFIPRLVDAGANLNVIKDEIVRKSIINMYNKIQELISHVRQQAEFEMQTDEESILDGNRNKKKRRREK